MCRAHVLRSPRWARMRPSGDGTTSMSRFQNRHENATPMARNAHARKYQSHSRPVAASSSAPVTAPASDVSLRAGGLAFDEHADVAAQQPDAHAGQHVVDGHVQARGPIARVGLHQLLDVPLHGVRVDRTGTGTDTAALRRLTFATADVAHARAATREATTSKAAEQAKRR